MERAIYALCLADAGVGALIGIGAPVTSLRFYPAVAPVGTQRPFAVYSRVTTTPTNTYSRNIAPHFQSDLQIDCYAESYAGAIGLGNAIRAAIVGANGTYGGDRVTQVWQMEAMTTYEDDTGLHRHMAEYSVHYEE